MRRSTAWLLVILMGMAGIGSAQDNTGSAPPPPPHAKKKKAAPSVAKPKFIPIEVQQFGWGRHSSLGYYYQGSPLNNLQDFERVIDPLNDPQASQLLRSSADRDGWGQGLLWGGIAVETAGWVDFVIQMTSLANTTTNQYGQTVNGNIDLGPSLVLIIAGNLGWVTGLFLDVDASNDRYNAVNRYNYVVQSGQKQSMMNRLDTHDPLQPDLSLSMMVLPDTRLTGLRLTQRF